MRKVTRKEFRRAIAAGMMEDWSLSIYDLRRLHAFCASAKTSGWSMPWRKKAFSCPLDQTDIGIAGHGSFYGPYDKKMTEILGTNGVEFEIVDSRLPFKERLTRLGLRFG